MKKLFLVFLVSIACCAVAGSLLAAPPAGGGGSQCADYCFCTSSCGTPCQDIHFRFSTCGEYGICSGSTYCHECGLTETSTEVLFGSSLLEILDAGGSVETVTHSEESPEPAEAEEDSEVD